MDPAKSLLKKLDREFYDENEYHIFSEITCSLTPEEDALADRIAEEVEKDIIDEADTEEDADGTEDD